MSRNQISKQLDYDSVQDEAERLRTEKPAILKCSCNTARRIRSASSEIKDLGLLNFLASLTIQPSDSIPDHLVFYADKHGNVLRMVNLREYKAKQRKKFLSTDLT